MIQAVDAAARADALDPSRSFIVQAPAGSGKTELLIRRYLRLLSVVERPEQVLAITFTRKAAGEMRQRIFAALFAADADERPREEHLVVGFELAQLALRRDKNLGWNLLRNPYRLRIQTIDAVNSRLSAGAPFSAGYTAAYAVTDNADELYRQAARQTIACALEPDAAGDAVNRLLQHFDNNVQRLENLLGRMLAGRDLWLHHVIPATDDETDALREGVLHGLQHMIERELQNLRRLLPAAHDDVVVALLRGAAMRLDEAGKKNIFDSWRDSETFPEPVVGELRRWQQLVDLPLTKAAKGPGWRKTFDARMGFKKADAAEEIDRVQLVVSDWAEVDGIVPAFREVRALPDPATDDGWPVVAAAITVLPLATAILKQVFRERHEKDYAEVAHEAILALGSADEPSELGLQLDYRLAHILVDEFQDTSRAQFELLRRLTAGWHAESGESLFLVGDPMQSIYRFREAEVGLYLRAREYGVGDVPLQPLRLVANFRSDPKIVAWNNRVYAAVFPPTADLNSGAVEFAPGQASHADDPQAQVCWHEIPYEDPDLEAERTVQIVREHLQRNAQQTLGILVRYKSHAEKISAALRAAGIRFAATEMEKLVEQSDVQDLVALTRGLYHLGDRLAWLALLRAPWCGLTLVDLHALATADRDAAIWPLANDPRVVGALSADGRARLTRVLPVLAAAMKRRGRLPVRDVVESAWLDLGGPAALMAEGEDSCAWVDRFLAHLDTLDVGGDIPDISSITEQLGDVYLSSGDADSSVQVMTMHKAKGLEFDTVLLPGLARIARTSDRKLLLTHEYAEGGASSTTLFAVRKSMASDDDDTLYKYLSELDRRKDELELDRLLYVATTRAKHRLHLFAQVTRDPETGEIKTPDSRSLLARIWPVAEGELLARPTGDAAARPLTAPVEGPDWREVMIRRLPLDWMRPDAELLTLPEHNVTVADTGEDVEFAWASGVAIQVGKVVHRWLQEFATRPADELTKETIEPLRDVFRRQLLRLGTDDTELEDAAERIMLALTRALTEDAGRWILSGEHQEAANELPLTHVVGGVPQQLMIDRTFVTRDGTRWIIDYKTSSHEGGGVEAFIVSETDRYRDQLRRYRDSMRELDARPIRAALYFPLLGVLREVDVDAAASE